MIVLLTHGAGSNCESPLLVKVGDALTAAGHHVVRYNLPYRRERPSGPPRRGEDIRDREGIREQVLAAREKWPGKTLIAGGHSYGGRQTSMAVAEDPALADGLLLLSYPLHPPKRREQLRTAHFPSLRTPALFVHGTRDPFGLPEEMEAALTGIPARHELLLLEGAGHELTSYRGPLAAAIVDAFRDFFSGA